jgi:AcrR family transcriptional regulator
MSSERVILSRATIASAAIGVLDESGMDGLTMRAVAGKLGAGTMSLYRHVENRDELLDLVVTELADKIQFDPLSGDWRTDLANVAGRMKEELVMRPQLTLLLTSRARATAASLRGLNSTLGILRTAGLGAREAVRANHALGNLVAGAALWEAQAGRPGSPQDASPAPELENLVWAEAELFAGTAHERFEHGLKLLLDGIQASLHDR